jgi:hypothetical protein
MSQIEPGAAAGPGGGDGDAALDPLGTLNPEDISLQFEGSDDDRPAGRRAGALSLADVVTQVLNGAVHDGAVGGGAKGQIRTGLVPPAAFAALRAASYAACFAAVVLLRDPVLLFACLMTLVTVFFGEWWFLYVASAIPLMYHISTTFNFLNGGMVPHVVAAASALNNMLNMVFVGVALIATWPSLKSLMALDLPAALSNTRRFAFILCTVSAKIVAENTAADAIATFIARALVGLKNTVRTIISVLWFIPGVLMDAAAAVA